jgi:hypothetical protein
MRDQNVPSLLLWVIPGYKRSWMQRCLIRNQLVKLYEILLYHHTTAYRKIRWLLDEKLLVVDKIDITEDGKKSSLFRTVLKSFNIKYEYNNVVIEAEQNYDTLKRITERFFSLDR